MIILFEKWFSLKEQILKGSRYNRKRKRLATSFSIFDHILILKSETFHKTSGIQKQEKKLRGASKTTTSNILRIMLILKVVSKLCIVCNSSKNLINHTLWDADQTEEQDKESR